MNLEEMKRIADGRTKGEWEVTKPLNKITDSEYMNKIYAEMDAYPAIKINGEMYIPHFYDYEDAGVPRKDADFIVMAANNFDKIKAILEIAKQLPTCKFENAQILLWSLEQAFEDLEKP